MDAGDAFRTALAHVYQRSGRAELSETAIANAMSHDLNWYPPKEARALVAALARSGHLVRTEDGDLRPGFDVKAVKVPLGFEPPRNAPPDVAPLREVASTPQALPAPLAPQPSPTPAPTHKAPQAPPLPRASDARPERPDLGELLAALAAASRVPVETWVARMEATVRKTGDALTPEAALLLAAARHGVDVAPWLGRVRAGLAAPSP